MRAVSKKRAALERVYRKRRPVFLEANPWCGFPGCLAAAAEVHHRKGRVGALLLDERFWTGLCHHHHQHVTEHPSEAYALGMSERRVS
jgi:hypothetical protein